MEGKEVMRLIESQSVMPEKDDYGLWSILSQLHYLCLSHRSRLEIAKEIGIYKDGDENLAEEIYAYTLSIRAFRKKGCLQPLLEAAEKYVRMELLRVGGRSNPISAKAANKHAYHYASEYNKRNFPGDFQ